MAKGGFRGMPRRDESGGYDEAGAEDAAGNASDAGRSRRPKPSRRQSGGGMVTATVNGKHEVVGIEIKPEAVDPDDVEMLQDMVIAAVNEAMRAADAEAANNMSRLTGGLNLGGLF